MAADVWAWCEKAGTFGRTVTVKVKFADFRLVTRSRSVPTAIVRHDLLCLMSVELVRTLLPTAKGVRLVGVTVSNFEQTLANTGDGPQLFGVGEAVVPETEATPSVAATGAH